MSCMTITDLDLFDPAFLSVVRQNISDAEPLALPLSLFDFPREPARRRKFDMFLRPEDDSERWDGLS
jgi:hypothetical protein